MMIKGTKRYKGEQKFNKFKQILYDAAQKVIGGEIALEQVVYDIIDNRMQMKTCKLLYVAVAEEMKGIFSDYQSARKYFYETFLNNFLPPIESSALQLLEQEIRKQFTGGKSTLYVINHLHDFIRQFKREERCLMTKKRLSTLVNNFNLTQKRQVKQPQRMAACGEEALAQKVKQKNVRNKELKKKQKPVAKIKTQISSQSSSFDKVKPFDLNVRFEADELKLLDQLEQIMDNL